jgi:hypothetical protein
MVTPFIKSSLINDYLEVVMVQNRKLQLEFFDIQYMNNTNEFNVMLMDSLDLLKNIGIDL